MNVHFIVVVPSLHPPRRLRWGRPLYLCQGGPERRNENCHCHCGHLLVSKAFHSRPGQTSGAPEPSCAAKPPSYPLMPQPDRDGVGRRHILQGVVQQDLHHLPQMGGHVPDRQPLLDVAAKFQPRSKHSSSKGSTASDTRRLQSSSSMAADRPLSTRAAPEGFPPAPASGGP